MSKKFNYFKLADLNYSPDKTYISFCIDVVGNGNYLFLTQHIYTGKIVLHNLSKSNREKFINLNDVFKNSIHSFHFINNIQSNNNYLWISNTQILYVSQNKSYGNYKCYSYDIDTKKRKLIKETIDKHKMMSIDSVYSNNYILLMFNTYNSNEFYTINVEDNNNNNVRCTVSEKPLLPEKYGVIYNYIDHIDSVWYICKNQNGVHKFMSTQDFKKFNILHVFKNKYTIIHNIIFLNGYFLFIIEQLSEFKIYRFHINQKSLCNNKNRIGCMIKMKLNESNQKNKRICPYKKSCYISPSMMFLENNEIYFSSMSFTNPGSLFSIKMDLHNNKLISNEVKMNKNNIQNFKISEPNLYNEETLIMKNNSISLHCIYLKKMGKNLKNIKNVKTVVIGYGSYGNVIKTSYNLYNCITLVNQGYLVIFTSIRGDGKLGSRQHINGRMTNKNNSFDDFLYILKYLYNKKITSPEKCAIWGRSAGGLVIGNLINNYENICSLAIMGVPFLMPYKSITSKDVPLSLESQTEWGNPLNKDIKSYIKSYDPYLNINLNHNYPNVFIYSNTDDSISMYKESQLYYEKIKKSNVFKNNDKDINLYIDTKYGHYQGSSFSETNRIYAMIFSMIYKYISP